MILTGGTGSRLGGLDKAGLQHDGRSFLDRALAAVSAAAEVAVVGREVDGGPLAGLAAGAASLHVETELVVVLAVDMPHVTADTVSRLVAAAQDADSAWLTDQDGRRQLAGAVRRSLVPTPDEAAGAPMRLLMERGEVRDVPTLGHEADDIDTWADMARLDCDP